MTYHPKQVQEMFKHYAISSDEDWRYDLQRAFKILTRDHQMLVSAVWIHQLPQEQVANRLGVNQSTVSRELYEAKCQIVDYLNQ